MESGGSDGLDLLQHAPQRGALADDLLEVVLRADFFFQVELFLGQSLLEFGDLAIGLRIFHGNRDLVGDLAQQLDLFRSKGILAATAQVQCAQCAVV